MNLFAVDEIKRKEIFILLLCLLIGFALRFYTFDKRSLWMDEIYTFSDSRDGIEGQLKFYEENPTHLHPPLFFALTHLFYPFTKPERDLRIIPLIFGTLSIPMIYFLARSFSPNIALPCTLSLTFMAYHISLSQDGRSYPMLMFLGMVGLYFFMKYLKTSKKRYLLLIALSFTILFFTSYSAILFMVLSQILWFYRTGESDKKPILSSFLILNGLIFLFCMPWLLFLALNYKGQPLLGTHSILDRLIPLFHMPLLIFMSLGSKGQSMDVYPIQKPDSFWNIFYGVISDWTVHIPLMIASIILLIFFPLVSKNKKNGFLLFSVFVLPIGGVYLFCKLFNVTHFVSSKYFINFLPLFFILLYLSLNAIDLKFQRLRGFARLKFFFVIFFIASNFAILPSYYRSEKRDYRGLVTYLKMHLQEGDRIIAGNRMDIQLMLHYFGVYPKDRYYVIPAWKVSEDEFENRIVLAYRDIKFTIICSKSHWFKYLTDGGRLWILSDKGNSRIIKEKLSCVLKGYFDGSFFNMNRFPTDASIYLFLWDPSSPGEKGIDMPIE